ncbi:MAG: ArsA family ATPase, partial [Kitasatospora sp.]|jgi:arsenite-transporting ATPase|nr:ArsA family ATPase [Kitasatospora sp.]
VHGRAAESVVANRVLPAASTDPWLAALSARQQSVLKRLGDDHPVRELPHLGPDADLEELAAALGDPAPAARIAAEPWTVDDLLAAEGVLQWRLPLPGAERDDLGLVRRGDELIVDLGPYRHVLPLPSALRRCVIAGARLRDGELRVRFEPDPDVWPR